MSQTRCFARRLCGRQLAPERLRLDVIGADPLAVDLDNRDQLAVAGLELAVAVDRYVVELEPELVAKRCELSVGPLAKVAALSCVENDAGGLLRLGPAHLVTVCYLDIGLWRRAIPSVSARDTLFEQVTDCYLLDGNATGTGHG